MARPDWPVAAPLAGAHVLLEPLAVDHADELAPVLADPALYAFTGGAPPTAAELRNRYARQVAGRSPDGAEGWLNWVLRRRDDGRVVGYVQATARRGADGLEAEVAWVVGTADQRQGLAGEAAALMAASLRAQGVVRLVAHVHPEHAASAAIARRVGLSPAGARRDGEQRFEG